MAEIRNAKSRKGVRVLLAILIVIAAIGISFTIWAYTPPKVMSDVNQYLSSSVNVSVEFDRTKGDIYFKPTSSDKNIGIIFYPGGRVNYKSYAPLLFKLAENGYYGVILKVPFNLAFFRINGAEDVLKKYPNVKWVVAGHSLGGVAASEYLYNNSDKIFGLILLASYPAKDISKIDKPVLELYGSQDGVMEPKTIDEKKSLMPSNTEYVMIEGGNHSQFGYYGLQSGDNVAKITREEQQSIVILHIVDFLTQLEENK